MSRDEKPTTTPTKENYSIPNFAYPLVSAKNEKSYFEALSKVYNGNFLFNHSGLWHGGIHFHGSALSELQGGAGIHSIADGELVAYRLNNEYLQTEGAKEDKGQYSNGFFLIRHKLEYPIGNVLTFFSLYMHTAKSSVYRHMEFIIKDPVLDSVQVLSEPLKVKAGEKIGLVGEYNFLGQKKNELLHLEVFTADNITKFASKAKQTYKTDNSKNKPKAQKLKIPEGVKIFDYTKEQRVFTSKRGKSNTLRVGFKSEIIDGKNPYKEKAYNIEEDILLTIDESKCENNRYQVLSIDGEDKSSENLTIYKGEIKKVPYDVFTDSETTMESNKIILQEEIKSKTATEDKKQYIMISDTHGVLLSECEHLHGITFDWAEIVDEQSVDDVSIFEDYEDFLNPNSKNIPQANTLFKKLFHAIDTNSNGKLDPQELIDAVKDKTVKQMASSLIVKHKSEWDSSVNPATIVLNMLETIEAKTKDTAFEVNFSEKIKQYLPKEEERVKKLDIFKECKGVKGFPSSSEVFHIHPIKLISELKSQQKCILTADKLKIIDKYVSISNAKKYLNGLNNTFKIYDINTCLRRIHFLAQVLHESAHLSATKEYKGESAKYAPYYGRGLIQLTHKGNYKNYSNDIGEDCYSNEDNRKKLENDPHAAQTAGWYWTERAKLNDEADNNDFLAITYQVNGGFNGFDDRYRILKNAVEEFSLDVNTVYDFKNSGIYSLYKASLAWGLWHDAGSNKFRSTSCEASSINATLGYNRFLELIKEKAIKFPIYDKTTGKVKRFYGHTNPKKYVEERLKDL